ncbi:MAG: arylsulfatase [Opitutales bacterium]|jgi:arylsulfatase A-like enzyme|nr:arylsulfatase [Opitutales bacterium]MDG2255658.1 arylsulfatase [Opitutaceae bacterium]MBT5169016.1 arylsulfatase [Opitutales bacterium]MBT5816269.1 arylsulfatase [Opitutales bacterium]MBT6379466.1 arylsulfatase [Opitutales bacterium]
MKSLVPLIIVSLIATAALAKQPNIIIVMTDDQGYPELSVNGNPILKTPHLDDLHSESLRLEDYHVSPMCAPTRGQLMTGLDAARNGCINVSSGRGLLRPEVPIMANFFGDAGYETGLFGKWHLGSNYPFRPEDRGFDETCWFPSSHIGSVPDFWGNDYFDDTYVNNGKWKKYKGYCTDVFFEESMSFMKQAARQGKPFLSIIMPNTPHGPLVAKDKDEAAIKKILDQPEFDDIDPAMKVRLADYLGMILNIDENMGAMMKFLADEGIKDDTIVIFQTDNGSTHGPRYYNAGMRGGKTELWEGGHRVPCFISWPNGGLLEPQDIQGLTQVQDMLPTLLDLCSIPNDAKFDGMSLASILKGKAVVPKDRMLVINYSRMPSFVNYPTPFAQTLMQRNMGEVLWKRWRLLEDRELYNLETDPLQQNNVIDKYPKVLSKMRGKLDDWWADVGPNANDVQRVIIGSEHENPSRLTGCEWLDVFIDQQRQIRVGQHKTGYWMLEVAEPGEYDFELRRWPKEIDRPLVAPSEDGQGAIPITQASFYLSNYHHLSISEKTAYGFEGETKQIGPNDTSVTFTAQLEKGPIALHTWFRGGAGHRGGGNLSTILSAYYVYVTKK